MTNKMGWSRSGAQYLLHVKTATINGRLERYTGRNSVPTRYGRLTPRFLPVSLNRRLRGREAHFWSTTGLDAFLREPASQLFNGRFIRTAMRKKDVDPQRVVELLKTVAANHPSIAKEPAPQAYIVNFAPGAVSFQLRAWTDRYEDWVQVRSDLSLAVDQAMTREKIAIA